MRKWQLDQGDQTIRSIDVRKDKGGWKSVLAASTIAQEQYDQKRKGFRGIFRRADVMLGNMSPALEPLTELLPCARPDQRSVKVLLIACKRKAEQESVLREILGDAPAFLQDAETFMSYYPNDAELDERVDSLYMALLAAIEVMTEWLTSLWFRTKSQAFDKVSPHRSAIDDAMKRLEQTATRCDQALQVENNELLKDIVKKLVVASKTDATVMQQLNLYAQSNDDLKATIVHLNKSTARSTDAILENISKLEQVFSSKLQALLDDSVQNREWQTKNFAMTRQENELLRQQNLELEMRNLSLEQYNHTLTVMSMLPQPVNAAFILQWLAVESTDDDVEFYAQRGGSAELGQKMSDALTESPALLRWLSSEDSILFINPTGAAAVRGNSSPGSFVVAGLSRVVDQQDYAVVLTYFCGQHRYSTSFDMVSNLLASLIEQLLQIYPLDLSTWSVASGYHREFQEQLARERNLAYLSQLFEHLILSITLHTVFVFIDDFFILEQSEEDESLEELLTTIDTLRGSPSFKLMCMTPMSGARGYVSDRIPQEEMLEIDLDEVSKGRAGLRSREQQYSTVPMSAFIGD
ncbi:hypothetical protein AMS68_006867 [Peltaster fructicola]|uniref:Uncharacterized protein n=1 Tax=Peltaster fructicola TaxID=286661 RepID=A0A6H0Y404_9PEZI|nr:hypothetical protein AMS68_006867 [Peltaster fructicola]